MKRQLIAVRMIGAALLVLAWALPLPAHAWAEDFMQRFIELGRSTTVLDIDNDTWLLTGSDRFYTSGLRLSRSYRLRSEDGWETLGWRVGQQLYTASSIQRRPEQLAALDHPYAGWVYAGLFHQRETSDGSEIALGLDLGCLGPCAGGEWTQSTLHRWLHQPSPVAWSTQIGTEAGVVFRAGARGPYWSLGKSIDLRPGIAVRVGNIFTDLSTEATLRAGALHDASGHRRYGFLRLAARAVGHDATLQGGWLTGTEERTVNPQRLTGEAELGLQWQSAQWALRVSVVRRANEIKGLSDAEGHQDFLRLSIAFTH